jgi:hypothetical protein
LLLSELDVLLLSGERNKQRFLFLTFRKIYIFL